VWEVASGRELRRFGPMNGPDFGGFAALGGGGGDAVAALGANSLALSGDGKVVAAAANDELAHLWDYATGAVTCRFSINGHDNDLLACVALSPDGKLLARSG